MGATRVVAPATMGVVTAMAAIIAPMPKALDGVGFRPGAGWRVAVARCVQRVRSGRALFVPIPYGGAAVGIRRAPWDRRPAMRGRRMSHFA
jgi:hypothetical protein